MTTVPINGARAIMGSRKESRRSHDFFPTPPWATRALMELVMPTLGVDIFRSAWEPACGEGHMAEVLKEYFEDVCSSDRYKYKYSASKFDFLSPTPLRADWIVTNPPFGQRAEAFVLLSLQRARVGVAMFLRQQWLESTGRYDRVFKPHKPAVIAQFAERVPIHKGRWRPAGVTATAYVWVVWLRCGTASTRFVWIPPGQREALTRPDDRERFTSHPVIRRSPLTDDCSNIRSPSIDSKSTNNSPSNHEEALDLS